MMRVFSILAAVAVGALAACGGSETGETAQFNSYNALKNEGDDIVNEAEHAQVFAPSSLPTTGSATYNGVMGLSLNADVTLTNNSLTIIGDMVMHANFATNTVDGSVDTFSDSDGDTYSGSLAIENGAIRRGVDTNLEVTILADIDGTITNDSSNIDYGVDGYFAGDFYGPNYEYVAGFVRGDLVTPNGTLLIWDNDSQGTPDGDAIFIGER